ncbi:Lysine-specific demethylase REF6 [Zea mays]|uniref:Lysine-specific demethylase REF6 n=1 Tax=Zea mays TaxID=4577 RepID=A0A1D6G6Q7_MAIZE|nr:Lysine-specific demethylase REF6 [Zea mays]
MASSQGESVPPWLKSLPLAPEFRPTVAEFADPIAYLLKIEPAAAPFGICKIVPPLPPPPKRTTLGNLSRSFAALHPDDPTPTFPTRHQQLGICPRRPRPALKPVWLSPHRYTLPKFEAKAGASRKALLARLNVPASKQLSPLDVEALFWRSSADRPVVVEYASDMPGSGFAPCAARLTQLPPANVGETAWNMRRVARSPASLLRFVREEVPGVTSPMLYVGMMFSWFAWHVEDHDLHSLNYMHYGAPKTWYGVPRDAALAFVEVVRVHGYGGEVNSLETFAMLGDKTTVMSPEVLVDSGIPCCRLVQSAGEFVVTFPGAYHSGFSHGFNCGEASNIATPEWLIVAKEAAVRRASINRPPMVSHCQLLYELALSLCLRDPSNDVMEPRSCRLKEKKKSEGDQLIKKIFVQNVIEDNKLLGHFLSDGSPCIILPVNYNDGSPLSTLLSKFQSTTDSRISHGQCSKAEAPKDSRRLPMDGADKNRELSSSNKNSLSAFSGKTVPLPPRICIHECANVTGASHAHNAENDKVDMNSAAGLLDQGLLSCVTCGILSFSCVAVIKPRECAAKWLMAADSSLINDRLASSGEHDIDALQGGRTTGGILQYPRIEVEAKLLAGEMDFEYDWKDILFKEVTIKDREKIQEVVRDEEAIPTNSDWAVKLGINLYYSANLAKSPLYSKQVPYNRVIYEAFGCGSPNDSPVKLKTYSRRQCRAKKIVLAGRWCGKVWMSNQVHPYLADRIKNHEPKEIDETFPSDQKSHAEPVENSSREAASTRKSSSRTIEGKTSKREKEQLEKANAKKPKFTEEDNSKSLEGTAEASTQKIKGRSVLEKTSKKEKAYTKKLKHTEKVSEALKGPSEASFPAPAGMVVRSSSRIANRKIMLKSKMEEEDNGSADRPKSKVEDDKDNPAGRSRAKPLRQKTKVDAKKKTKETRVEKRKAPSPASQKDEEEQSDDVEGRSTTKQRLSLRKKGAKTEGKQRMEKPRFGGSAPPPSSPKRKEEYVCDIEGCSMSFGTEQALSLHKNDICPEKGCCRKFFSHKYLQQHRKVHADDRPLKCPWEGCGMAFKWPWARTEHVRVHTGDRPYVCLEPGCGQTFRFVSDFSRHKRRTGHGASKKAKAKKQGKAAVT